MSTSTNRLSSPARLNSSIPRRAPLNRTDSNSSTNSRIPVTNPEAFKWKHKYEDAEQKRKTILIENEKTSRQLNELNRKHLDLQIKNEHLETELFEKNEEYGKLKEASQNLYKEYDRLKNQYETETGAMSRALKDASQWYKENKELKRRTMLFLDKDTVDEGVDAGEGSESDLDNLKETIKQLSGEVAELRTENDSLRQTEFQTTEENIKLSEELEAEKIKTQKLEQNFLEIKEKYEQIIRVSTMLKRDLQELQKNDEEQKSTITSIRREADNYKKERNVLKHQSTLLLQGLNNEDGDDSLLFLQEVEDLKRTIEEERNKHEEEVNCLQEKIEEFENNPRVEILEERLKLVEAELLEALHNAEKAPPTPPPPPPPPTQPPVVPLRVKRRSRVNVSEIADCIGITEPADKKPPAAGVNEDIINAIKEGKFTLRKAKNGNKKEKEGTKAVSEILNILGNLRRAPKKRQSQLFGDVQL